MKSKHSEIEALICEGKKIQAIKLWREYTGNSLKDAKDIIEHFEQHQVWISVDDLPTQMPKPSGSPPLQDLNTESLSSGSQEAMSTESICAALLNEGKKVQAIKLWRENTGASLKEAKMQIEQFERDGTWSAIVTPPSLEAHHTPEPEDHIGAEESVDPIARQGFGVGYWLVVLILLGFLATQFLS